MNPATGDPDGIPEPEGAAGLGRKDHHGGQQAGSLQPAGGHQQWQRGQVLRRRCWKEEGLRDLRVLIIRGGYRERKYEHSMWFIRATGVKLFFQQNFLYLLKLAPFYNAFLLPKEKRYHCINFRMQVGVC